jgi:MscS family membrane protein
VPLPFAKSISAAGRDSLLIRHIGIGSGISGEGPAATLQNLAFPGQVGGIPFAGHGLVTTAPFMLRRVLAACVVGALVFAADVQGQTPAAPQAPSAAAPASPDALGRDTPRGSVLGFLNAARKGENELAAQYLSTRLTGAPAATLAHQLYVVLDARLPPRLTQVSDAPEGSRASPLKPNEETVGAVAGADGPVDIIVERVPGADAKPIWLFSVKTLNAVPTLYREVTFGLGERFLPRVLTGTRVGGVRVLEWLIVLLGLPLLYLVTAVLDRLLRPAVAGVWRRLIKESTLFDTHILPLPIRLLIVAAAMRWLLSSLPLPLMIRQFGSTTATLISIVAIVWAVILLNGEVETHVNRRFPRARAAAARSLVRVVRRGVDLLAIFAGVLVTLRHFGVDPTPALAGLGVGGIAVALAAQKTLENVIAGASLIFDQAVTAGDFLKMGEISGTVDHIGLLDAHPHTRPDDRERAEQPDRQRLSTGIISSNCRSRSSLASPISSLVPVQKSPFGMSIAPRTPSARVRK